MRIALILLALLAIMGLSAAYLDPQTRADVHYSEGSAGTFIANQSQNSLPLPILDLTGLGYMAMKIYDLPVMQNDGDVNRSHYKDAYNPFWYPNLTV